MRKRFLKDENGASAVVVAIVFSLIVGCAALVIDLGASYHRYVKLQDAVDNAVRTAGTILPTNNECLVKDTIKKNLEENGFDSNALSLQYNIGNLRNCKYYAVRLTAQSKVKYGFANIFGDKNGKVSATAKVSKKALGGSTKGLSLYITEGKFDADNIRIGEKVQISYANNGSTACISVSGGGMEAASMGLIELTTPEIEENLEKYNEFSNATQRDKYYMKYGYYGLDADGNKIGLSVGDVRALEMDTSRFAQSKQGLKDRLSMCAEQCGKKCSYTNYLNSCPKIALIPVVAPTNRTVGENIRGTADFSAGSNATTINTPNVVIRYFIAVYIDSVTHKGNNITMNAYFLDDYRHPAGTGLFDDDIDVNKLTVLGSVFEE